MISHSTHMHFILILEGFQSLKEENNMHTLHGRDIGKRSFDYITEITVSNIIIYIKYFGNKKMQFILFSCA